MTFVRYWWRSPRELWAFVLRTELWWGRNHTVGVKTWSLGPITVAHCNLDWLSR